MLSIVIPARNEDHLSATVRDLLAHTRTEVEILPVLEGYRPVLPVDPRIKPIYHRQPQGMRPSINEAVSAARGDYILKCDAHCSFADGFDQLLIPACARGTVVVPTRYELDPVSWVRVPQPPITAHYLSFPFAQFKTPDKLPQWHGRPWWDRMARTLSEPISDEMTFQGSCWMMRREDWQPLQVAGYGTFVQEPEEIALRFWFSGGRVVCVKTTWYAHWRKREGQGYIRSRRETREGRAYSLWHWLFEQEDAFAQYLARFWPVPGWPDNWRDHVESIRRRPEPMRALLEPYRPGPSGEGPG